MQDLRKNELAVFLANWAKNPLETGALAPSSKDLALAMCETMYLGEGCVVLELGPGTGPFTREILARIENHDHANYLGKNVPPSAFILFILSPIHVFQDRLDPL